MFKPLLQSLTYGPSFSITPNIMQETNFLRVVPVSNLQGKITHVFGYRKMQKTKGDTNLCALFKPTN